GIMPGLLEYRLIVLRQRVPFFQVDEGEQHRPALPPARRVIMRRHLVEAELLIIIRSDPLAGIERAFFQGRIDIAASNLMRAPPELLENLPGPAADPHLQALEIVDRIDFLAIP